jgi:putative DNA primase/helicase
MITKIVAVPYDTEAIPRVWDQFLTQIFQGDTDLYDFCMRAIGYSITGVIRDHALFIAHGSGRNGKSTMMETVAHVLGDYAMHSPMDTFMSKKNDGGIPNDLARLKGARMVIASESEQGHRLREGMVKQLTGGDKITARFMRAEFFEFSPEFKIFLVCNHKPKIGGTDKGIWSRVHMIPFNYTIPKHLENPELPDQLRAEATEILRWMVIGCEMWSASRLGTCDAVTVATGGYREEMDTLKSFIQDRCKEKSDASIRSSSLYKSYSNWAKENGEFVMSQTLFSGRLKDLGYSKTHTNIGKVWTGLELTQDYTL